MLIHKPIIRFTILWLIGTFLATVLGIVKDQLDYKFKISTSWYFIRNYGWADELISCAFFLFIIILIYFVIYYFKPKIFENLWITILICFLLSFIVVPLFFPQTPFPRYLFSFKAFGNYLFGLLEIGLVGTMFPLIEKFLIKHLLKKHINQ